MVDERLLEGVDILANAISHIRHQCWGLKLPDPLLLSEVLTSSIEYDTSFLWPAKDVQTGGPDTPSDAFVSFTL